MHIHIHIFFQTLALICLIYLVAGGNHKEVHTQTRQTCMHAYIPEWQTLTACTHTHFFGKCSIDMLDIFSSGNHKVMCFLKHTSVLTELQSSNMKIHILIHIFSQIVALICLIYLVA